jgi:integrase
MNPILKGDKIETRILRPSEFEQLLKGAGSLEFQTNLKALLLMGCRYLEGTKIQKHPEWYDHETGTIHIKEKKVKRTAKERYIRLSHIGHEVIPHFLQGKPLPKHPQGFLQDMRRWAVIGGLDPVGLSARTLRKSWESWLMVCYPERSSFIYLSQGHTELVSLQHYQGIPFTAADKEDMKKWTEGWKI